MTRIVYGSSAGVAAVAAIITAVLLPGANNGNETPAAEAQTVRSNPLQRVGPPEGGRYERSEAVSVTAVSPTVEDLHRVTTQPAHVESYERTNVYAKASGFVSKVHVDIGDVVREKQVLAELWIPEMEQEQLQKSAQVEQARAAVEQAQARLGSAEALVTAAEARLAEAHASIAQHEAEIAFRKSEHARIAELVQSRSVNAAMQDEKLNQLRAAEAALVAARAQIQSAEANVDVERARKLQAEADVDYAKSQLKVADADLLRTEILIQYAQVRAPYAGLVTRRAVDTGDFVASAANGGQPEPLFTVDRVDKLRIVFDVPENESAQVHIDQPASLVVDALKGRSFAGRIARTAGVLDPRTRTLRVEAELDEPEPVLRAGMFGMVSVTLAERPRAVMLPTRALRYEDRTPFVYCVHNGVVRKHPVTLGYSDGARCEIVEGIGAESRVIVDSRFPVRPGQPVQVAASR
ncbi:MAG: efflux RND transporter periplasmic adaptor subunit [Planctomycetales bacterium]